MSRSTAITVAATLAGLLVLFVVLSLITSTSAWILWSAVPLLLGLGFVLAAIRGETLGERKRERDVLLAERKAAARKSRAAGRPAG